MPIAIEGPTPVSSLLHSSTIVVAGVFLFSLTNINLMVVSISAILVLFTVSLMDVKKIIAYSTSVNLILMLLMSSLGLWGLVLLHIFVHAWFKAAMFVYSGSIIHSHGGQFLRSNFIVFGFVILIAISGTLVSITKEIVVMLFGLSIL